MFTDEDVEVVSQRLGAWSEALRELAEPELCRTLLSALDTGDGKAFHELVGRWGFIERATCVEISEIFTRFVHTGDFDPTEVCVIVERPRPLNASVTTGKGYRLQNGRILWLSDAEWWEMMDRVVADEKWRDENHDLLVAIGIMSCHMELVPSIQRFDITKQYTICPHTEVDDRRR